MVPSVLLIAGPSSIGKSTASAAIGRQLGRTWLAVDDLRLAVQQLVPDPASETPLHYFERTPDVWSRPLAERVSAFVGIAEYLRPGIEIIVRNHLAIGVHMVIEGDGVHPSLLDAPDLAEARAQGRLAMVVVAPPTPDLVRAGIVARGWAQGMTAAALTATVTAKFAYGQALAQEARARDLPVIDAEPQATLATRVIDAVVVGS